jgi:protein arginine N-methyltransferase 1
MLRWVYNLNEYALIVGDSRRMRAYADAIAQAVRPGFVVVDLGAGGGILSVLAARAGARRVYAVEAMPLGSVVADAAGRSGVGDLVTFVHGMSRDVTLPERADVIVSDLRGVLPWFRTHLPSIVDARTRFLRQGGALIPERDSLEAALVEAPDLYRRHVGAFDDAPYGVHLDALRDMAVNRWYRGPKDEVSLIGNTETIVTLDYAEIAGPDLDATFDLVATRSATAHGFCVWFDSTLAEGVVLSNSPADDETVYGRAFFPFERPSDVCAGDRARVRLRATFVDADYVWTWETDLAGRAAAARFRQSTFRGIAIR